MRGLINPRLTLCGAGLGRRVAQWLFYVVKGR
nr:MAG TPA: IlvGEDA operon leader peptide [Herelleviridae sp.]